jgi:hypothetical protein
MVAAILGIDDFHVALAYILCLASTLLCVIYGLICWNRGEEKVDAEDIKWAQKEKKAEDEL